jgi:DNA-binding GntR family transcriptional regulator
MKSSREFGNLKINKGNSNSLRDYIIRGVTEGIYSGALPPGSRLVESELANKFQISRTPVREAILQLESEGLVKILPNRGAVVNVYSIEEIDEIYIIFGVLEGIAASLSVEFVNEEELKQMENYIAKMETSKQNKDRKEWFIYNNEFHSSYLKPCRKKHLLKLIKNYTTQIGRYWYLLLSHAENMELFAEDHKRILEAFKLKDSKMAREQVENHVRSFGKIVVDSLRTISPIEFGYPISEGIWRRSEL